MKNQLAILVMTCDAFADAWEPFFNMFFKYWSDCKYPIYLGGETIQCNRSNITTFLPGENLQWSKRLEMALEQIPEQYVLLLLEDYVLLKSVKNERIKKHLDILIENNAAYLRLVPAPPPDEPLAGYPGVGVIKPGSEYRNSTQAAIWHKECLLKLIDPKESVWDFELVGVNRTKNFKEPFLSVEPDEKNSCVEEGDYPITYFCTAITRGKWLRQAVKIIKENGFEVDLKTRPQETVLEDWKRYFWKNYNAHFKG